MFCQQEHIDHPMSLLDLRLRQGGRYAHYIFDMAGTSWLVFPDVYQARWRHFPHLDDRLGTMYRPQNRHRHPAVCRSGVQACSRRLSSILSRCTMGHESTVADIDLDSGCPVLPQGIGR